MAARENQGYLIAVIVLVLLTLVLALVAFLGVQKAYEQAEAAEAVEAKLNVARQIAKAEGLKGNALKGIIGLGVTPAEINKAIQDLQVLSTNRDLAEADKKHIGDILTEVRKAKEAYDLETGGRIQSGDDDAAKVATLLSRITDLTALVDRIRKDYKNESRRASDAAEAAEKDIERAEKTLKSREEELLAVKQNASEAAAAALVKETTLTEEVEANKKAIAEVTRKSEEAAQQAAAMIREQKNQITVIEEENVNLKTTLNQLTRESFENSDGKVVRVAISADTVFIDIGRADGLTANRTFSVYDQAVTDFKNATPKAMIEVVRVGDFRSEARVISQNLVDPILRNDHILTATWDPGFMVKFALAGRFDLDGDRFDDTEKLIRMIERNGGEVVVSHDLKGKITGEMSPEVRYLVKGNAELIGGQDDDPDAGEILNVVRDLESAALKNTVQVIDLQKLLNRMGVRARPKTSQLDFPPGGFVPRQPGGSTTRQPAGSDTRQPAGSATR